ncbi:MAG TPA: SDR family oxidoreductase [Sporolactobacillaceae bacterium]|nr:SDR family oxidoreductase [Sporolactobacillaceae bacterium]
MANTYLFTGFPGFIATNLVKQVIRDRQDVEHIYVLVLPNFVNKAEETIANIVETMGIARSQFTIVEGDITKPNLALEAEIREKLKECLTHVFHLAAIYDLAVPEKLAVEVNVDGTKNVNDWVQTLNQLKRYVYFSTSYVAGTREGRILETELEMGQTFKNHYERTKYEAEVLVKGIMNAVPTTVIRPGIVVGHSETGETVKFDGPYFILNFIDRLKFLPIIPYMGHGEAEGNFVPIDFIFRATIYLGHSEAGVGKTYQLTDPKPYKAKDVYRMLMKEYLGREPKGRIPLSWGKAMLSSSRMRKWVRTEKEALAYFTCKAEYDCTQTQKDLAGSGIACPDFKDVIPAMVAFYKTHKDDPTKQLHIK